MFSKFHTWSFSDNRCVEQTNHSVSYMSQRSGYNANDIHWNLPQLVLWNLSSWTCTKEYIY